MRVVSALAILTRIPIPTAGSTAGTGAAAFGLVGGLIGAAGAIPLLLLGSAEPWLAAIVALAIMTILSGGLHLDGLADTTDALLAPDPARAEVARKDPAIGTGGIVALVLVLGAQVAALSSLAGHPGPVWAGLACVSAGATSRALGVVAVRVWRSRATTAGFGHWFADRIGAGEAVVAVGTGGAAAAIAGLVVGSVAIPIGVALGAAIGLVIAAAIVRARGQIDGDGIGAVIELSAAAILTVLAILPVGPT